MTAPAPAQVVQTDDGWLHDLLPKSAHRHIKAILENFATQPVAEVEITGARVAVERVEAFGLRIGLDVLGRAVYVHFPLGAEVTEWAS
jgi:hypothetical protein